MMMKRTALSLLALTILSWTALSAANALDREEAGQPLTPTQEAALADSLIESWLQAVGGLDTYALLRSASFTVTTELYDAESGRLKRTRPRYVTINRTDAGEISRVERWEGDDFIEQRWDGSTGWAAVNGEPLGPGEKDFDQVPYVSGDVQYWISLPYKLRDGGVNLHYRGRDDDGRHVVGVSFGDGIGLHDTDTWEYRFEDGRSWPVEVWYREVTDKDWNRLRMEDIRTVGGYIFVGRRVYHDAQGRRIKVLATTDFVLNPEVTAADFQAR
jgi:hypothetical protein